MDTPIYLFLNVTVILIEVRIYAQIFDILT